jgi:transposase, IS5 family
MIKGFFDLDARLAKIDSNGDVLAQLNAAVDWELFRPTLQRLRDKPGKSPAGRKGFDLVLMFKVLILQSLYGLSDAQTEGQILDRLSFTRFLGLSLGDAVPDEKTIWKFRDELARAGLAEALFAGFDGFLRANGFAARKGQIVDASIVRVPRQHNRRDENAAIKEGDTPEEWSEEKRRQKDADATWTKKSGRYEFGYKNHIQVDVENKFIRDYAVTAAGVHDSQVFGGLLDPRNTSADVWADSAYRSAEHERMLADNGYRSHVQRKAQKGRPLGAHEIRGNRRRSRVRARVEHVFGMQVQRMGGRLTRGVGLVRVGCRVGLRNLAYNLTRFSHLLSSAT